MRLTKYLNPSQILAPLDASSRDEVFAALAELAARVDPGVDSHDVEQGLRAREEEYTTVLGEGIAIPHATVDALTSPLLLLGVTREPIRFGPEGAGKVDVFFSLLSPRDHQRVHIKILARICRLARDPGMVEAMRLKGGPSEVFEAIRIIDERHV